MRPRHKNVMGRNLENQSGKVAEAWQWKALNARLWRPSRSPTTPFWGRAAQNELVVRLTKDERGSHAPPWDGVQARGLAGVPGDSYAAQETFLNLGLEWGCCQLPRTWLTDLLKATVCFPALGSHAKSARWGWQSWREEE